MRLIVAYGLIAAVIAGLIALGFYARYNSRDRRLAREREVDRQRRIARTGIED